MDGRSPLWGHGSFQQEQETYELLDSGSQRSEMTHHNKHQHHEDDDLTAVNKAHWDKYGASAFDAPWIQTISRVIAENLKKIPLPESFSLLDYACGNGLITRTFSPKITKARGIDLSTSMVAAYNIEVAKLGLESTAHAIEGNLLSEDSSDIQALSSPDLLSFDIAAISMALHHVSQPEALLQKLADRVRPGGQIVVVDFWSEHEEAELPATADAKKTISRHWFGKGEMEGFLKDAGCEKVEIHGLEETVTIPEEHSKVAGGVLRNLMLAVGWKGN